MKNAKKVLLSAGVVVTFVAYSWQQRHDTSQALVAPSSASSGQSQSSSTGTITLEDDNVPNSNASSSNSSSTSNGSNNPSSSTAGAGKYKDGEYIGNAADAYYGYIQVKAIIKGGKITDVVFLQSPSDRQNSVYINSQADPWLKQEAIQAQSAKVNVISGATDTSLAFIESLTNALNKAV